MIVLVAVLRRPVRVEYAFWMMYYDHLSSYVLT
jgi:hypothetical protein